MFSPFSLPRPASCLRAIPVALLSLLLGISQAAGQEEQPRDRFVDIAVSDSDRNTRVVVTLPRKTAYKVHNVDGAIVAVFGIREAIPDLFALRGRRLHNLAGIEADVRPDRLMLGFVPLEGRVVQHRARGREVIFDFHRRNASPPAPVARLARPPRNRTRPADGVTGSRTVRKEPIPPPVAQQKDTGPGRRAERQPESTPPAGTQPPAPGPARPGTTPSLATGTPQDTGPPPGTTPAATSEPDLREPQDSGPPAPPPAETGPALAQEDTGAGPEIRSPVPDYFSSEEELVAETLAAIAAAAGNMQPGSRIGTETDDRGGFHLLFGWGRNVPAAVFQRSRSLWIVFDRYRRFDVDRLVAENPGVVTGAVQYPRTETSIMRLSLSPGKTVRTMYDNATGTWRVSILPAEAFTPPVPPVIRADFSSPADPKLVMDIPAGAPMITLTDDTVGDTLHVIPIATADSGSGSGIPGLVSYVDLELLPSAHGVVIRPKSDDLVITVRPLQILVRRTGGLRMLPPALTLSDLAGNPGTDTLLDYESWRGDGDFHARKHEIQVAISQTIRRARTLEQMKLASFFFSVGFYPDALAVLAIISGRDQAVADSTPARLLHAATLTEMRRYEEATPILAELAKNNDREPLLWLARATAEQEDHARALELFEQAGPLVASYPHDRRYPFELARVRALFHTGDIQKARIIIEKLLRETPPEDIAAELLLLKAEIDFRSGALGAGFETLDIVTTSRHRPAAVRARFLMVEYGLKEGTITSTEAIEEMERLRLIWRGDNFEPTVLWRIAQLRIRDRQWREAFDILRIGARKFPDLPSGQKMATELEKIFGNLFLGNEANTIPPVEALALFFDFRDLIPGGSRGTLMMRNLVDRLAGVDLLDGAADLLELMIDRRLEGEEKARAINHLAALRLLDRKPEDAIGALERHDGRSDNPEILSEARRLRASALAGMDRFDEAWNLIRGDNDPAAAALRADIAWRAKDWSRAALALERILRASPRTAAESRETRNQVLQLGIAYTLAGDRDGLARLREIHGEAFEGTPEGDAFSILTDFASASPDDLKSATSRMGGIRQIETFLSLYQERLRAGNLFRERS